MHLLWALVVVVLGSVVQGVLGFGSSLVWMAFFPLFTTVPVAVGVLQPLAITLNFVLLFKLWKHTTPRDLVPLVFTVPIGIGCGVWVVTSWPEPAINGLLGTFILCYCWHNRKDVVLHPADAGAGAGAADAADTDATASPSFLPPLRDTSTHSTTVDLPYPTCPPARVQLPSFSFSITSTFAGFFGGCLTSAFGTGGPAILVYARERGWETEQFRGNLQIIFFSMNVLANTSLVWKEVITMESMQTSARLVPALLVGGWAGNVLAAKIRKDLFRMLVLSGLAAMGLLYVSKAGYALAHPAPAPAPAPALT